MTCTAQFLVCLAWKRGNSCKVERCVPWVWRPGFRSSLLFTDSMTLNSTLRPSIKAVRRVLTSKAGCEGSVSPAGSWMIVTAWQILVESLSISLFPGSSFRKFVQGRGLYWIEQGTFPRVGPLCHSFVGTSRWRRVWPWVQIPTFGVTLLVLCSIQTRLNSVGFSPDSAPYWQATTLPNSTFLVQAVGTKPWV